MKSIFDIQYGKLPEQILDIHLPDCEEFPVFIYFHGGGIEEGSKGLADHIKEYFTNNGICLVSANYRMYPTARFPDYIIDAAKADGVSIIITCDNGIAAYEEIAYGKRLGMTIIVTDHH